MQFLPRYQTLEAVPVAALDEAGAVTAQREYIVTFDDGTRGVLDRFTFEAFFCRPNDAGAGSAPEPAARGGGPRKVADGKPGGAPAVRKSAKAAKQERVRKVESIVMPSGEDKPSARILTALARGPQSFTELMNNTGLEYSQAHPACRGLEGKGKIIGIKDPHDATETKRYKLA